MTGKKLVKKFFGHNCVRQLIVRIHIVARVRGKRQNVVADVFIPK